MFRVSNKDTRTTTTMKIPERRHWRRSGIFIVNFEQISHLALVFLLLTLSRYMPAGKRFQERRLLLLQFS